MSEHSGSLSGTFNASPTDALNHHFRLRDTVLLLRTLRAEATRKLAG